MLHEVVAALIIRSHTILLGQRASARALYPGVWDLFGGHVESGETQEQTLIRELQEELGITPSKWTFLQTFTVALPSSQPEAHDELVAHLYLVTAWSGTPANLQPEEHDTIGWFSLAQAVQLTLADPIYPVIFEKYLI